MFQHISVKKHLQKNKGKSSEGDARLARPAIAAHSTAEGPDENDPPVVQKGSNVDTSAALLWKATWSQAGKTSHEIYQIYHVKVLLYRINASFFVCSRQLRTFDLLFHSCNLLRFLGANTSPSPASSRSRKLWQIWTSCLGYSEVLILWSLKN